MEHTQQRIKNLVETYKMGFPEEYRDACKVVEQNRKLQNDEFASTNQELNTLQRAVYEIPETLLTVFIKNLSEDELRYLKSKEGARWFARALPQFSLAHKI